MPQPPRPFPHGCTRRSRPGPGRRPAVRRSPCRRRDSPRSYDDISLMNTALALEHEAIWAYGLAGKQRPALGEGEGGRPAVPGQPPDPPGPAFGRHQEQERPAGRARVQDRVRLRRTARQRERRPRAGLQAGGRGRARVPLRRGPVCRPRTLRRRRKDPFRRGAPRYDPAIGPRTGAGTDLPADRKLTGPGPARQLFEAPADIPTGSGCAGTSSGIAYGSALQVLPDDQVEGESPDFHLAAGIERLANLPRP